MPFENILRGIKDMMRTKFSTQIYSKNLTMKYMLKNFARKISYFRIPSF